MSVTCGFYNSVNGDRKYGSPQMSQIFDGVINDGVFMNVGGALMVTPGTGMSVIVASGRAWFDGTWTYNDSDYPVSIAQSEVILNRIDAIVLETNSSPDVRDNTIKVVKGVPNADAVKPELINSDLIHQHALAYVTVQAGVTEITEADIEIMVGKTECPFVTAILETTDISDLMNQWQAQFDAWFATIEETLSGDVAGNLQNQINSVRDRVEDLESDSIQFDGKYLCTSEKNRITPDAYKVGEIINSARTDYDSTWLLCNSTPIDSAEYPELASILRSNGTYLLDSTEKISNNLYTLQPTEIYTSFDAYVDVVSCAWVEDGQQIIFAAARFMTSQSVGCYIGVMWNVTTRAVTPFPKIGNISSPSTLLSAVKKENIVYVVMRDKKFNESNSVLLFNITEKTSTSRSFALPQAPAASTSPMGNISRFAEFEGEVYVVIMGSYTSGDRSPKFELYRLKNNLAFTYITTVEMSDFLLYNQNPAVIHDFRILSDGSAVVSGNVQTENRYATHFAYKTADIRNIGQWELIGKNRLSDATSSNWIPMSDGRHLIEVYNYVDHGTSIQMYNSTGQQISSTSLGSGSAKFIQAEYNEEADAIYVARNMIDGYFQDRTISYPITKGKFSKALTSTLEIVSSLSNDIGKARPFIFDGHYGLAVAYISGTYGYLSVYYRYSDLKAKTPYKDGEESYFYIKGRE